MVPSLRTLNNATLARLLMRLLWNVLDRGGVSYRRTYFAQLFEEAMELVPLPEDAKGLYPEEVELFVIADERFVLSVHVAEQTFLPQLGFLTPTELAYLLLWHTQEVCAEEQAQRPNGLTSCTLRYLERILPLLQPREDLSTFAGYPAESLRIEASSRRFAESEKVFASK